MEKETLKCKSCGAATTISSKTCIYCGASFAEQEIIAEAAAEESEKESAEESAEVKEEQEQPQGRSFTVRAKNLIKLDDAVNLEDDYACMTIVAIAQALITLVLHMDCEATIANMTRASLISIATAIVMVRKSVKAKKINNDNWKAFFEDLKAANVASDAEIESLMARTDKLHAHDNALYQTLGYGIATLYPATNILSDNESVATFGVVTTVMTAAMALGRAFRKHNLKKQIAGDNWDRIVEDIARMEGVSQEEEQSIEVAPVKILNSNR